MHGMRKPQRFERVVTVFQRLCVVLFKRVFDHFGCFANGLDHFFLLVRETLEHDIDRGFQLLSFRYVGLGGRAEPHLQVLVRSAARQFRPGRLRHLLGLRAFIAPAGHHLGGVVAPTFICHPFQTALVLVKRVVVAIHWVVEGVVGHIAREKYLR